MARVYFNRDLDWKGNRLGLIKGRRLVEIVADAKYPTMWRVWYPDGSKTDMYNIVRARDHARTIALEILNAAQSPPEGSPVRLNLVT